MLIEAIKALLESVKDHKLRSTLTGLFSLAMLAAGSIWAYGIVDSRYAHAGEVKDLQRVMERQNSEVQNAIALSTLSTPTLDSSRKSS